nr:hypothetical protein NCPCFENI_01240 [Cupriavidus sp.]
MNLGDLRHLAQQLITLIEQRGRLAIKILGLTQLLVYQRELLRELIQLRHLGLNQPLGFLVHEVELGIELAEPAGQRLGLTQKLAAHNQRRRVCGELTRGIKELIEGRQQAHVFATQNVYHTACIVHHGALGTKLRSGIA